MTNKYAIIGNPVEHSLSPFIHQEFARVCGIDLRYDKILAPLDNFLSSVDFFVKNGGCGANITVPFKTQAYLLADNLTERAKQSGAANTLSFNNGVISADNTDGEGLVRDLKQNLAYDLHDKRVLLLGAGGAARGVLFPLIAESPAKLLIANRNVDKAVNLANAANKLGQVYASDYLSLSGQEFDLIINATSSSLFGERLALPLTSVAPGALIYDMMYGKQPSPFLEWAKASQAATLADGLGMLVEQAAEAFFVWHGIRPQSTHVLQALRNNYKFD